MKSITAVIACLWVAFPAPSAMAEEARAPIQSCALSGATTLMVKDLLRTESSNAVVTYMVLLMTPISLAPALFVWEWPEPGTWAILIGVGLIATIGHICITHSYKLAEASAVLPCAIWRTEAASSPAFSASSPSTATSPRSRSSSHIAA